MSSTAACPWDSPYPPLSYSESQQRRRERCAREYYHATYTAHRGWRAPPFSDPWVAYRAKVATPLAAAVGTAVHSAAAACVRALVTGAPFPDFETLRGIAGELLNTQWRNSRTRRDEFLQIPKQVPLFLEALYGDGPTHAELLRAARSLDRALLTLIACERIWEWVRGAAPSDVVLMEPFARITRRDDIGDIECYGAADLLVRPSPDAPWHIIDFKSGRADGVIDQILMYALVARETLGIGVEPRCIGVVASLAEHPRDAVAEFAITPEDLRDAETRLRRNIASARAATYDPVTGGVRPIESFPMTMETQRCRWCAFRALCDPSHVAPSGAFAPLLQASGVSGASVCHSAVTRSTGSAR